MKMRVLPLQEMLFESLDPASWPFWTPTPPLLSSLACVFSPYLFLSIPPILYTSGQYLLIIGRPYDEFCPKPAGNLGPERTPHRQAQRVVMAHQAIDLSQADPLREAMWNLEVLHAWGKEATPLSA